MTYGLISVSDDLAAYTKWSSNYLSWGMHGAFPSYYTGVLVPFKDSLGNYPLYSSVFDSNSLNTAEQNAALHAFSAISHFSNLIVTKTTDGESGDINFGTLSSGYTALEGQTAWASEGSSSMPTNSAGDIWLTSAAGIDSTGVGSDDRGYYVIAHEIGHAIGLAHAYSQLPSEYNSQKYSIMSYNKIPGYKDVIEYQLYDIASIQYHYGRNDLFHSGSDAYTISDFVWNNPVTGVLENRYFSLWDGSGVDTISATNSSEAAYIDLRPGHFSSIGSQVGVDVDGGDIIATGVENVSIAFGAYLENATGSASDDIIVGNILGNYIVGGEGNDIIFGSGYSIRLAAEDYHDFALLDNDDGNYDKITAGGINSSSLQEESLVSDILNGGSGDDIIFGSRGTDNISGGDGIDRLFGGDGDDSIFGDDGNDMLWGGNGNDVILAGTSTAQDEMWDEMWGGAGDDILVGGNGYGNFYGDEGNDTFLVTSGASYLEGGQGSDIFWIQKSSTPGVIEIENADPDDVLIWNGYQIDDFRVYNLDIEYFEDDPSTIHSVAYGYSNEQAMLFMIGHVVETTGDHTIYYDNLEIIMPDNTSINITHWEDGDLGISLIGPSIEAPDVYSAPHFSTADDGIFQGADGRILSDEFNDALNIAGPIPLPNYTFA